MRALAIDPGETTGWSLWEDDEFVDAGQEAMWSFADSLFEAVMGPYMGLLSPEPGSLADRLMGIDTIICEDFKIYPWEAKAGNLNWNAVRTARLIGAITLIARQGNLHFHLQPAKIKERGLASGAEAYFLKPLYENRHANDATTHYSYFRAVSAGTAKPIPEDEERRSIEGQDG